MSLELPYLKPKKEGGPGSGRYAAGSGASPSVHSSPPNVLAHHSYSGDQYKAGVRYPKADPIPKKVSNPTPKTSADIKKQNDDELDRRRKAMYQKEAEDAHSKKWQDCVHDVGAKGRVDNPYAVCTSSLGHQSEAMAGGVLKPHEKKECECDSASSMPGTLRSQKKESKENKKPGNLNIKTSLKESSYIGSKFEVVLIQEGLGNFRDCFYYTKDALKKAASLFEGKKAFLDHPTPKEDKERPERSTKDIFGYYENVRYQESSDGRGMLVCDVCIDNSPALELPRSHLRTSIDYAKKYPNSDFVGLSINASGDASLFLLDDFMRSTELPPSVLPKLQEAKANGIEQIQVVSLLTEATSVDLVTEAGAGGKILQMIESEKKPMKKENEKKEKETKEAMEDTSSMAGQKADGAQPDHDDADQDTELFKKLVAQYLGDDQSENAEAHEMAKHAYQANKEGGMDHEAAYEAAGKHLQMASEVGKRMAQKQAAESESESESESKEAGLPVVGSKEGDDDSDMPQAPMPPSEPKKKKEIERHYESAQKSLVKAKAEIARLQESLKKYELKEYLDKKLSESKRPFEVTKKFREALGSPRSKDQIDSMYKVFMSALEMKSEDADDFSSFIMTEKTGLMESNRNEKVVSFDDCV